MCLWTNRNCKDLINKQTWTISNKTIERVVNCPFCSNFAILQFAKNYCEFNRESVIPWGKRRKLPFKTTTNHYSIAKICHLPSILPIELYKQSGHCGPRWGPMAVTTFWLVRYKTPICKQLAKSCLSAVGLSQQLELQDSFEILPAFLRDSLDFILNVCQNRCGYLIFKFYSTFWHFWFGQDSFVWNYSKNWMIVEDFFKDPWQFFRNSSE